MKEEFLLTSGKTCQLIRIRNDLIPNYYILTFSHIQSEPNSEEITEMLVIGTKKARQLAFDYIRDSEAFTLLYSGYSARREKGWYIHIVLLGNRWRKAWLYFVLAGKNLPQALRIRKDDAPRVSI